MRASLDTNVIIHFYRAGLQNILFDFFDEGIFIYEQIRNVELEHHGQDVLDIVDSDIKDGKIVEYTDDGLRELGIYKIFESNVIDNKMLYGSGDLGEVYAIALAQTLGIFALVTDDIKQGGPYMSLLQFEDDILPFTFADILIIRYITGDADSLTTVNDFNLINQASSLNWAFKSQIKRFIRRFWSDPYTKKDTEWMKIVVNQYEIPVREKFSELSRLL